MTEFSEVAEELAAIVSRFGPKHAKLVAIQERRPPQSVKSLSRCRSCAFSGVYFVQGARSLDIKIGFSKHVAKRVGALAVASSEELRFMGAIAGTKEDECSLHQRFAHLKVRGEWFAARPELTAFIQMRTKALPQNSRELYFEA